MAFPVMALSAAAVSATSAFVEGTNRAGLYNTQAREYEMQANLVPGATDAQLRQFERGAKYRMGAIIAGLAHSGVDVSSGSAAEVALAQARADGMTKLQITTAGALQERNLRFQSQMADYQRRVANRQRIMGAIGGAMSAASPFIAASPTVPAPTPTPAPTPLPPLTPTP
ncbi:internal virion protein B-like protein [Caudoviricetes sp.]|nr:internal virion protein B-like protein [Caudoviricetes sp.]UOF79634.1 internal virion protein B-like protein [Caudoviricetes sp.]UOF79825.1 internal virion protein B-like protein [Bacteriophage sp.]UOF81305.1 internal virion protein B-like protein [Caudoviricetes sp.]